MDKLGAVSISTAFIWLLIALKVLAFTEIEFPTKRDRRLVLLHIAIGIFYQTLILILY